METNSAVAWGCFTAALVVWRNLFQSTNRNDMNIVNKTKLRKILKAMSIH